MKAVIISIVVPVYQVEDFIKYTINSLICQTFKNFEVLVVNDGTKDKSIEITKKITENDERFIYINQENSGLSVARNNAIDVAKGDYISFLDSDDYLHCDHYEYMYKKIIEEAADVCVCDVDLVRENRSFITSRKNNYTNSIDGIEAFIDEIQAISILSTAPAKLYKKELFEDIRYPAGLFYEDKATTYKIFLKAKKVCFINKSLYYYTQRQGSITKGLSNKKIEDRITVLKNMKIYLKDRNIFDKYVKEYTVCYLLNIPLALGVLIAMYSNDYPSQVKEFLMKVDSELFTFRNIFLLRKTNLKKMLGLLLLKISPKIFLKIAVKQKRKN
jgi:glycosyltransferase involved in cell wall biosynthesis